MRYGREEINLLKYVEWLFLTFRVSTSVLWFIHYPSKFLLISTYNSIKWFLFLWLVEFRLQLISTSPRLDPYIFLLLNLWKKSFIFPHLWMSVFLRMKIFWASFSWIDNTLDRISADSRWSWERVNVSWDFDFTPIFMKNSLLDMKIKKKFAYNEVE